MRKYCYLFFLFFPAMSCHISFGQNKAIDVRHYSFAISLNDSNNIIHGTAGIDFIAEQPAAMVYFDLRGFIDSTGKGMKVLHVFQNNKSLQFLQDTDRVKIFFDSPLPLYAEEDISISYAGVPADGLIIDTNKFAHRTFFADNWPNRAHNWIPCNDHPADKASVEFIVTAPDHYQVVANGILVEESNLPHHLKLSHWSEDMVLPTKVMVIGVADFAVQLAATIDCVPITSWVFPENKDSGFAQYAISKNILPFYENYIGPYPYGTDTLKKAMKHDRDEVIAFYKKRKTPVVDTSAGNNLMHLLNSNSYQKGSWVLHMLRRKLGDEIFKKGIQAYYAVYKGKNASTVDLMHIMEKVSKQNLQLFFKQWLYTPGQPVLQGKWKYNVNKKILNITMQQTQNYLFQFPLQIAIKGGNKSVFKTIDFNNRTINISVPVNFMPQTILLDPEINLLFEGNIEQQK
jgi:aminopeptidase N